MLKRNNRDSLYEDKDPVTAVTGSVRDALELGCSAIGYTIYPGSAHCKEMYEQLREIAREAREHGLAVGGWSYPRGSQLRDDGETAIEVRAYIGRHAA